MRELDARLRAIAISVRDGRRLVRHHVLG